MTLLSILAIQTQWEYTFANEYKTQKFYQGCTYEVQLWGANGGIGCQAGNCKYTGGTGAYIKGTVTLSSTKDMSIVVGGKGGDANKNNPSGGTAGYNGGGSPGTDKGYLGGNKDDPSGGGGGATDLRIKDGVRIMAAGAGSGGVCHNNGAHGGGLNEHGFVMENHQVAYSNSGGTGSANGGNGYNAMSCPSSGGGGGWEGGISVKYDGLEYHDGVARSGSSGYDSAYVVLKEVKRGDQVTASKPNGNGYAIVKLTNWQSKTCLCPKPTPSRSISPSRSVSPSPSSSVSPSRSISPSRSPIPSEKIGRKGNLGFHLPKIFKASIQTFMLLSFVI